MIKRILRYTFLLLTLLLLTAWSVSYWRTLWWTYKEDASAGQAWSVGITQGAVYVQKLTGPAADLAGTWSASLLSDGFQWHYSVRPRREWSLRTVFPAPSMHTAPLNRPGAVTVTSVDIPLWMISLPAVLITVWLWYPWFRERRQERIVGFEVETKTIESKSELTKPAVRRAQAESHLRMAAS